MYFIIRRTKPDRIGTIKFSNTCVENQSPETVKAHSQDFILMTDKIAQIDTTDITVKTDKVAKTDTIARTDKAAKADTVTKTKTKRLSKGQRKHVRRMKQEARRAGIPDNQIKNRVRTSEAPKK